MEEQLAHTIDVLDNATGHRIWSKSDARVGLGDFEVVGSCVLYSPQSGPDVGWVVLESIRDGVPHRWTRPRRYPDLLELRFSPDTVVHVTWPYVLTGLGGLDVYGADAWPKDCTPSLLNPGPTGYSL